MTPINRRETILGAAAAASLCGLESLGAPADAKKRIAGVVTAYEPRLHADVLLGKILAGWKQDGGPGPNLELASMYVDQFTDRDLARDLAKKHNIPIAKTIDEALTLGGDKLAVDGVISIGEHGAYPYNKLGQHLYPRRRFFAEITDTFRRCGQVVPVFNDKHLGPQWQDAIWMYERARELKVPFMAGSSLPVSFRKPNLEIPLGCELESALGVGYSGLDVYGSHTLDCYQCLVERRRGGESGVVSVQCLSGKSMWNALTDRLDPSLFEAVIEVLPKRDNAILSHKDHCLFLFEYADGFSGMVLMLTRYVAGIGAAVKVKGQPVKATHFEERTEPYYPHFAYLLKGVEGMMLSGKPSYPVERTLLTSGILDRALRSRAQDQRKLETPELKIAYSPTAYPHAPQPNLLH